MARTMMLFLAAFLFVASVQAQGWTPGVATFTGEVCQGLQHLLERRAWFKERQIHYNVVLSLASCAPLAPGARLTQLHVCNRSSHGV